MSSEAFLILGAAYNQIPLIKKASELGLRTVAVDFNDEPPGKCHCDVYHRVSYRDEKKVLEVAKKYKVAAIGTIGTNDAICTASSLTYHLGLPALYDPPEVIRRATYKNMWRKRLTEKGVPIAAGRECASISDVRDAVSIIGLPVIVKPTDGSGAKGCSVIEEEGGLISCYEEARNHSGSGIVIIEKYLGCNSFAVESFVLDGQVHFLCIGQRKLPEPPITVTLGTTYPDNLPVNVRERVKEINVGAIEALEIGYGPVHIDMAIDDRGTPHVIDVGPRLLGGPAGWDLIPRLTGINLVEAVTRQCLGERVEPVPRDNTPHFYALRGLFSRRSGTLLRVEMGPSQLEEHNLMEMEIFAKRGDYLQEPRNSSHRYGFVTAWGNTYLEATQKVDSFAQQVIFHIDSK